MTGWRTALRIARREVRRAKGRSALVVALLGLPVALLAFAAVSFDSFRLSTAQELDRELGTAAAELTWQHDVPIEQDHRGQGFSASGGERRDAPPTAEELAAVLSPDDRAVPSLTRSVDMSTASGLDTLELEGADLTDPVHDGRITLRDGAAPGPGEAALTRRAADRLGAELGDTVATADGDTQWDVVGIVEYPERFDERMVVHPDTLDTTADSWYLISSDPVRWDEVRELNTHGIQVRSRAVALDPPPMDQRYETFQVSSASSSTNVAEAISLGTLVVGLAVLEVVLLAGPAFAVGVRRRQRELALAAVSGATPAHLRRVVLADGVVLGTLGAAAGLALGSAVAAGGLPLLEEQVFDRRSGGVSLWPVALASLAGIAVVTGLLAALIPAATVARQDVVRALAGRRGTTGSRRRWLVVGLAMAGVGAVLASAGAWLTTPGLLLAGLVLAQLGLVLCTPRIIGLVARVGRWLPLATRVALRDTARNRSSAAPAVSAVMAAVAGAVAIGTYIASGDARTENRYQAGLPHGYVQTVGPRNDVLDEAQQQQLHQALAELPEATQVISRETVACPPGTDWGEESTRHEAAARAPGPVDPEEAQRRDRCSLSVPLPEENQCPVERGREPPTAAEQRTLREDPRCSRGVVSVGSSSLGDMVTDGSTLEELTGASSQEAQQARQVLADGGVVVLDPMRVHGGEATVRVHHPQYEDSLEDRPEHTVPATVLTTSDIGNPAARFYSPALVADIGLDTMAAGTVAVTRTPPARESMDALRARLDAVHPQVSASVEDGPPREEPFVLILAAVAGTVALGAAAIATGLAAADRRPDLATLAAVGASPRVRRVLSLSQSGVIAGLGAVLGCLAGFGTGVAIVTMANQSLRDSAVFHVPDLYPIVVPWSVLAVLAIVPLVAMLGAGLFTRSRLPAERRPT